MLGLKKFRPSPNFLVKALRAFTQLLPPCMAVFVKKKQAKAPKSLDKIKDKGYNVKPPPDRQFYQIILAAQDKKCCRSVHNKRNYCPNKR